MEMDGTVIYSHFFVIPTLLNFCLHERKLLYTWLKTDNNVLDVQFYRVYEIMNTQNQWIIFCKGYHLNA